MSKPGAFLDPIKEAKAVAALRSSLADLAGDDDLLLDTIEGETSLFEAIDALLLRIVESTGALKGVREAIGTLEHRSERFQKRAETARALIEQALLVADLEKVERPTGTLSLTRRAAKVEITEEADIPADFWKPGEPRLDKKAVLDALKDGRAVPGACLTNSAPSLTIRTA